MKIHSFLYRTLMTGLVLLPACLQGYAQLYRPDDIRKNFVAYQSHALQEKIFLHADKSFYLAGEIVWFRIYDVDAFRHMPLNISAVCYIELLLANKPVLQIKAAMKNGSGNGSLQLPASLVSGNYTLRAYSAWMKNFDPAFYFEQTLTVVNTLKASLPLAEEKRARYQIQFFPEGGNLVYGLPSKLAFKITDRYGAGVDGRVVVTDQDNTQAAAAQPLRLGMGSFVFTPSGGKRYKASVSLRDTAFVQDIPMPYLEGFTLGVTEAAGGNLRIAVAANGSLLNSAAYLLVHSRQVVKMAQLMQLSNGRAELLVDKKILDDGISVFTLFNPNRQPVCERLYGKKPEKQLSVKAQTDQPTYAPRGRVEISLTTVEQQVPAAASLSMSVFLLDSLQPARYEDILTYLLLQSDLAGYIESPQSYFTDDAQAPAALDNLMLTQGWRRFRWEDVQEEKAPAFQYVPEPEGLVVYGLVTDRRSGTIMPGIAATLSVPGQEFSFGNAVSRPNGSIRFNMGNFFAGREVIAEAVSPADSTARIDLENPFSEKYSGRALIPFSLRDNMKDQLLLRSIHVQAENSYLIDKKQHSFLREQPDTTMFYGKPDYHYHLDDYTRFITMEEVMKEFVMPVRVRKQGDAYRFKVYNSVTETFFEEDPLVLLDGIPVRNADKIMTLDPLKVKDIDVMSHVYHIGSFSSQGLVSYRTRAGDQAGYRLDPSAIVLEYEGLQHQREFYTPVYQTDEQLKSRIPDLRNQLCWAPQLQTGADGKTKAGFYTSDVPGVYLVVVQGITPEGLAGSSSIKITVGK